VRAIAKESLGKVKISNLKSELASFSDIPNVQAGRSWDWRGG